MGKHPTDRREKSSTQSRRPKPYGSRPHVDVLFEGAPPTKQNNPVPLPPISGSRNFNSASVRSADVKGKAKASPPPSSDVPTDINDLLGREEERSGGTFIIVAGSYEKLLYGIEGSFRPGEHKPTLKPIFIFPAHLGCVKAVAASPGGKWLATGSEDEFIKVWDLRRRKEVGSLSQHSGSITSLHFPTSSHLVSTSVDATLSLFRTSDWALLKSLKGHSGRVNDVDIHYTGRVALSVGKDQTLKMWDLMRGRGASSLALGQEAELVSWSPTGMFFAVLFTHKIEIYSLSIKLLHTLESKIRFNTMTIASLPSTDPDGQPTLVLCVGTEKGVVEVHRLEEPIEEGDPWNVIKISTLGGHTNRIKSVSTLDFTRDGIASTLLSSVSSDGLINVYDLSPVMEKSEETSQPIATYDTKGSRLTCVVMADGKKEFKASKGKVNKRPEDEVESDGDTSGSEEEGDDDIYDASGDEGEDGEGEDGVEVELEEDEEEEEEEEEGEVE
ncbi:hypothetical protein M231_05067 [Tremella mesenterica]|uniref:Uncharacterized protein n=1 Tax=Tremella mesenterica TaxID=5217 RepID=A0A4Q1BJ44_TREME|nr:hypothetical protein M231_05067 [Tremella mesenterica]